MIEATSILDQIGNTPLVEATHILKKEGVRLFLKLEGKNPGGSVKDRAAYNMILQALQRGDIKKGDKLVEATSGNTGMAVAIQASPKGYRSILVMSEIQSLERRQILKAMGAELILTPGQSRQ